MEIGETQRLRLSIERSLKGAFDPADVLPRLHLLARFAAPRSDEGVFANQKLAELLAERDPWRAALHVRRAIAARASDDRSWAILAFCQTLLGNYRCASRAYERAIACAPANPWYAHNLGHILDVALGDSPRALRWLRRAYEARGGESSEIVASYVHALARAGQLDEARAILERARSRFDSRELGALTRWLDQGAPRRTTKGKRRVTRAPTRLTRVLSRGLSHLPLDPQQRERALALARDASTETREVTSIQGSAGPSAARGTVDVASLAAAVAYAIVYIDHVPLSQAEVAAPFRVGVAHLRGRFAELRAKLDIIRGDVRYATTRR